MADLKELKPIIEQYLRGEGRGAPINTTATKFGVSWGIIKRMVKAIDDENLPTPTVVEETPKTVVEETPKTVVGSKSPKRDMIAEFIRGEGAGTAINSIAKRFDCSWKLAKSVHDEVTKPSDSGNHKTVTHDGKCVSYTPTGNQTFIVGNMYRKENYRDPFVTITFIENGEITYVIGDEQSSMDITDEETFAQMASEHDVSVNIPYTTSRALAVASGIILTAETSFSIGGVPLTELYPVLTGAKEVETIDIDSEISLQGGSVLSSSRELQQSSSGVSECPYKILASSRSITIFVDDKQLCVTKDSGAQYTKAVKAIEAKDWAALKEACDARTQVSADIKKLLTPYGFDISGGYVVMNDNTGKFRLGGSETLSKRIEKLAIDGNTKGIDNLGKFIDKLLDNPDIKIMDRVVDFMKFADIEIDNDGDLLVYKYVNADYKDSYSKSLDNSVGSLVRMKRALIDPNSSVECSQGLHVCSITYVSKTGSNGRNRIVKAKLNPRDIVSIPKDYNGAKIRCCEYLVVADVTTDYHSGKIKVDHKGVFA